MILFVTGQYAGAQYILPLLRRWGVRPPVAWRVAAHGPSARCLAEAGVACDELAGPARATAEAALDAAGPSLVVLSASVDDPYEREFVLAARERGVPTARALDMWSNYAARFGYGGSSLYPDHVLAIDERCAGELEADGVPAGLLRVVGQPYLEEVASRMPARGEGILLPGQPVAKYWGRSLGYDERDFWALALAGLDGVDGVIATRHPDEEEPPPVARGGCAWRPGRGGADVEACHTVLGMFSMQMVVGHLWGRKVASLQPGLNGKDPCPLSRWGVVPLLQTADEVRAFAAQAHDPRAGEGMRSSLAGSLDRLEAFCLGFASA